MLSRIISAFSSTAPSAILVVGNFEEEIGILHIIPEDGTVERFGLSPCYTSTYRYGGAVEQAREQIGVVTLGDDETVSSVLTDVEARARKLLKTSWSSRQQVGTNIKVAQLAQDVLRSAALDAMREREGKAAPLNATQTYPVYEHDRGVSARGLEEGCKLRAAPASEQACYSNPRTRLLEELQQLVSPYIPPQYSACLPFIPTMSDSYCTTSSVVPTTE
ncbi:hypothetical protein C8Q76DRAFT_730555 [Earliella scabrosa]|nr:hypothetical protein C8Q76DRAFT_730555 [Earliella scabrosa]